MTLRDPTETELPAIVEIHNAAIASRTSAAQLERLEWRNTATGFRRIRHTSIPLWVVQTHNAIVQARRDPVFV